MPLDPAFVADCFYEDDGLLIDEIVEVDQDKSLVRVRMPTSADLPLTRNQRVDPKKHPRHVSGGLMVHMTGVVAFAHFYYVLGLRHADGWSGYGVRIHDARFRHLAEPGAPIVISCRATKIRKLKDKISARYAFEFVQHERVVYDGEQSAFWVRHS